MHGSTHTHACMTFVQIVRVCVHMCNGASNCFTKSLDIITHDVYFDTHALPTRRAVISRSRFRLGSHEADDGIW